MTITISGMFPLSWDPFCVIVLVTMTAMNWGTLAGGGVEFPGSVVQVPPQVCAPRVEKPAKPLSWFGGGSGPLMGLSCAHWLPHQVTELPTVASLSPIRKPPCAVANAKIYTEQLAVVVAPPSSLTVVVTVNGPVLV